MKVGDIHRFIITYVPDDPEGICQSLYIGVKNVENVFLTPNILSGPYMLYCDIAPADFDNTKRCFITADQPHYNPNVMPGQNIHASLSCHTMQSKHVWVVNVISQIVFNTSSEINFEIFICRKPEQLHKRYYKDFYGNFAQNLDVQHFTTLDLWNQPPLFIPCKEHPVHLVILTHGLYSNTTADMFYMKQRIQQMCARTGENIVIRGFTGNVCKTERGVKYLGRRLAEWIVKTVVPEIGQVMKISFIAHSLGGLVQTFAIAYIQHNYPNFFHTVHPENFVAMASPLLGISNENPAYVKLFLSMGVVGKTGQDLGLQSSKPLLLLLPSKATRKVLRKFKRRTVYANTLHDGIVPLRTAALLFLDWNGLAQMYGTLKLSGSLNPNYENLEEAASSDEHVSEIPANVEREEDDENQDQDQVIAESTGNSLSDSAGIEVAAEGPDGNGQGMLDLIKAKLQSWVSTTPSTAGNTRMSKKVKRYQRFQTTIDDDDGDVSDVQKVPATPIPKTNILSGLSRVLLPPRPDSDFILDPSTRNNVILHDKIYRPSMIPKPKISKSNSFINSMDTTSRQRMLEEKIARKWHKGLTWRKVLVNIPPDAHNNMIVRRNFANAYGWPVVQHMVESHFGEKCYKGEDWGDFALNPEDEASDSDEGDLGIEEKMSKILDKEHAKSIAESNKSTQIPVKPNPKRQPIASTDQEEEEEDDEDESWMDDNNSIIYDGPTGMLNTIPEGVSGQVEALKKTIFFDEEDKTDLHEHKNYKLDPSEEDAKSTFANDPSQLMNNYL
ncbi:hypothetical protein FOA43_000701 [Brettanomyces nanus]|uniref:DUF676 domain-containing protein n=1 Tax=Eeniella nana TaxID=13502 RepID=A0A875RW58_EENNA|nr:uncharacterized protein FOA43_000701 [Brettanomyces nanus]QPG73391.1 hypothetical protein FOA43_000701 [Brettanomyces nanus]